MTRKVQEDPLLRIRLEEENRKAEKIEQLRIRQRLEVGSRKGQKSSVPDKVSRKYPLSMPHGSFNWVVETKEGSVKHSSLFSFAWQLLCSLAHVDQSHVLIFVSSSY